MPITRQAKASPRKLRKVFGCGATSTYWILTCRIHATMPITRQTKGSPRKIRKVFGCGATSTYWILTCRIHAPMPIATEAKGSLRKIRGVLGRWHLHILNPYLSNPCYHADQQISHRQLKKNSWGFGAVISQPIESLLVESMRPCWSPGKPKGSARKIRKVFGCGAASTYWILTCRNHATMLITDKRQACREKHRKGFEGCNLHRLNPYWSHLLHCHLRLCKITSYG